MTQPNERLINAKEKIARTGIAKGVGVGGMSGAERLPPGQKLVNNAADFPVLDLGIQPDVSYADWRLELFGACQSPVILSAKQFEMLGLVDLVTDFHCVTTW